jgi:hypothetical protein
LLADQRLEEKLPTSWGGMEHPNNQKLDCAWFGLIRGLTATLIAQGKSVNVREAVLDCIQREYEVGLDV